VARQQQQKIEKSMKTGGKTAEMRVLAIFGSNGSLCGYHVSFSHVDITKMMPMRCVWDIFTQMSRGVKEGADLHNSTMFRTRSGAEMQLDKLLN